MKQTTKQAIGIVAIILVGLALIIWAGIESNCFGSQLVTP